MKKGKKKDFIEQLKLCPIVTVAYEKAKVTRQTVYRWRVEDNEFAKEWDDALKEGDMRMNDLAESKHLKLINEGYWPALKFFLMYHHPKYQPQSRMQLEYLIRRNVDEMKRAFSHDWDKEHNEMQKYAFEAAMEEIETSGMKISLNSERSAKKMQDRMDKRDQEPLT